MRNAITKKLSIIGSLAALISLVTLTVPVAASSALNTGTLTYPNVDKTIPMTHHWPLQTNAVDTLNGDNLSILSAFAPQVKYNGSSAQFLADDGLLYNSNVTGTSATIQPGTNDWVIANSFKTADGHYNMVQFGTSRSTHPWGLIKLTGHACSISGVNGSVDLVNPTNESNNVNHYASCQRVGNTFEYRIDGVLIKSKTANIGAIDFSPSTGSHGLMFGGKIEYSAWQAGTYHRDATDMLTGYIWNVQWAQAAPGSH